MFSKEDQTSRKGKIDWSVIDAAARKLRDSQGAKAEAERKAGLLEVTKPKRVVQRPVEETTQEGPQEPEGRTEVSTSGGDAIALFGDDGLAPVEEHASLGEAAMPVASAMLPETSAEPQTEGASAAAPEPEPQQAPERKTFRGRPRKVVAQLMADEGVSRAEAEARVDAALAK